MRTIDTVIFDMDGVIIDSEPIHSEVEQQMFKNSGVTLSPEEHQKFTGTASLEMWTDIVERFRLPTPPDELRSEERRVGKECRDTGSADQKKNNKESSSIGGCRVR